MSITNTHDQLVAAGGGIAIVPSYAPDRSRARTGWHVYRVQADGAKLVTDPDAALWDYGCKSFGLGTNVKVALAEAKAWVAATYDEHGPWVRNRLGDYLPERVAVAYPLREPPRRAEARATPAPERNHGGSTPCVRSGFCCKRAPCGYGEWDAQAHQCQFLLPDPESSVGQYICGKYNEIVLDPDSHWSPAFGAGCSSSLFNDDRDRVLVALRTKEHP